MGRLPRGVAAFLGVLLVGGLTGCAGAAHTSAKLGAASVGPGAATAGTTRTLPNATARTARTRKHEPNCSRTSIGDTPLTQLGTGRYKGYQGGLYPGGANTPPKGYLDAGLAAAKLVRPLGPNGTPSSSGRIVVLSIGMSNAYLQYRHFITLAGTNTVRVGSPLRAGSLLVAGTLKANPRVELVNGATPNWAATEILGAEATYHHILNADLADAGVTADQVQAVWIYEAIENESQPFPADSMTLRQYLGEIISMLTADFPNLRLVYMSSREYAGYATSIINPEPYAYESGFAVKWEVARRMAHPGSRPWVAWGPYTWADGTQPRNDGLTWLCSDFQHDGTHPSARGAQKAGYLLWHFFTTSPTTRTWFNG